jgi:SAM-dependent methyltransferase
MLLMLNARLGKCRDIRLAGIDLDPDSIRYAQTFAEHVPGYANCQFQVADLSHSLPFADHTFDAVNLGDVLEHMENPPAAIRELMRVTKPGGVILISTPLKNGLFKRVAALGNRITHGRLYRDYYRGKSTELDGEGNPVMVTRVGHPHISEMTFRELKTLLQGEGLDLERMEMMPVMSGSKWFERIPFTLAGLMFVEALHSLLGRPSWAHSVMILARKRK